MRRPKEYARIYRASGKVSSRDPLVHFLYLVMRGELPAGRVHELVREARGIDVHGRSAPRVTFSNGWLARYARWLARELRRKGPVLPAP